MQRPPRIDVLVAITLAVGAQAELRFSPAVDPDLAALSPLAVACALLPLALAWRRSAPLVAACVGGGVTAVQGVLVAPAVLVVQVLALLVAAYSVAAYAPLRRAVAGLTAEVAGVAALAVAAGETFATVPLFLGAPWFAGRLVRRLREQTRQLHDVLVELEHERERSVRLAGAEERARIARDLHDVLAHGIGVVALQAAGARRVLASDPDAATEALAAIEEAARSAQIEVRHLLDLLGPEHEEHDGAPLPRLSSAEQLVESARRAGLPVEYRVDGEPVPLPAAVDVAAYRILQESLTNAVRHAPGAATRVRVAYSRDDVELEVHDEGSGAGTAATKTVGSGRGLTGMRARAALHGGAVEAGPAAPRGFRVRARLPLGESVA